MIDEECSAGLEMAPQSLEAISILLPARADAEYTAQIDGAVLSRHLQLVQSLTLERGVEALARCRGRAEREHVGGHVGAVDVEPFAQIWQEQAPRAAADVEHGLT